jgi:hypothetical protein
MSDRQLLIDAAKAADYGFIYKRKISNNVHEWTSSDGMLWQWNPLIDDAQALRLAVKLKMEVYHGNDEGEAVYASHVKLDGGISYCVEYYDDLNNKGSEYEATRRAIVRAAAEIGKAM